MSNQEQVTVELQELIAEIPDIAPQAIGPRMRFQWGCLAKAIGPVLNVGSCDDPLRFGDRVVHLDYDDWSAYFRSVGAPFIQGDAHRLTEYFGLRLFDLVIMGDVLEHVVDPNTVIRNCCQVSNRAICLTVWEEWRHESPGQWVAETLASMGEEAHAEGLTDYYDLYEQRHPEVVAKRDQSHLGHINQFTDEDAREWCQTIIDEGFQLDVAVRFPEVVHEDHQCYNWLIYATRRE